MARNVNENILLALTVCGAKKSSELFYDAIV